jgi:hypothetical protein
MKTALVAGLLLIAAQTAVRADSLEFATHLGNMLASESVCGLSYKAEAIEGLIAKKVKADDIEFPSTLNVMTSGSEYQLRDLTASAKVAHCAQVRRAAKAYGFID